jgi:hypothetical protein
LTKSHVANEMSGRGWGRQGTTSAAVAAWKQLKKWQFEPDLGYYRKTCRTCKPEKGHGGEQCFSHSPYEFDLRADHCLGLSRFLPEDDLSPGFNLQKRQLIELIAV